MKRIIILFCLISFTLCGCGYINPDEQYMVSAIGVEEKGALTLYAETVSIGTDKSTAEPRVFKASGKTVEDAVNNLQNGCAKSLILDHCAVIILDSNISPKTKAEVFSFCKTQKSFNISACAVKTDNIEKLLSCTPETATVGYDIYGILKRKKISKEAKIFKSVGGRIKLYTVNRKNDTPTVKVTE